MQAALNRNSARLALDGDRFGQLEKLLNAAGMYTAFLAEQLAHMAEGNAAEKGPCSTATPEAVVGSKRKLAQTQTQAAPGVQVGEQTQHGLAVAPVLDEDAKVPACPSQAPHAARAILSAVLYGFHGKILLLVHEQCICST